MIHVFKYDFFAPLWLWLLLCVPLLLGWMWYCELHKKGDWKYTGSIDDQKRYGTWYIHWIRKALLLNCAVVTALLVLSMAKPYDWEEPEHTYHQHKNGIDIILTIDVSGSMMETDFYPSRIEVAKKVAKEFVDGRRNDRIGLVAYAGQAFTACPTTTDYKVLKKQIDALNCNLNIEGGTAIGVGLGTAVTRLRNDSIQSKVIILITDGSNNMGTIAPLEAAQLAKAKDIRVYTIGMVPAMNNQQKPLAILQEKEPDIDEATLMEIARQTKGSYFRASNEQGLRNIYAEIDKMEKRLIIDQHVKSEPPANPDSLLSAAFLLMIISWSIPHLLFWNND